MIIDYTNIHKYMNFVVISLDSSEDEQQIFDTINSLGVKLTTGELLKNHFFTGANVLDYEKIWKPIFEGSPETIDFWNSQITTGRLNKKTIDVFLYYYLQIKSQEKGIKGDIKSFRRWENLFSSFKTMIEDNHIDKELLALEITAYAQIFMDCFRRNDDSNDIPSSFGIERISFIISNLDLTTLIPYVLYIVNSISNTDERNKIFGYLETYVVRRIITDASNKNYSDLFTENLIGQGIQTFDSLVKYISTKDTSTSLAMPSDDAVRLGFKQTQFKNNKRALAILYLLESATHSTSHSTKLRTFDAYSLEHLMPKKWKQHWTGPTTCNDTERDANILTLGNLAIIATGLNNAVRNYDWQTKIAGKNDRPGLKEFSTGIITIDKYLSLEQWDESTIEQRANDLALLANKKWSIN